MQNTSNNLNTLNKNFIGKLKIIYPHLLAWGLYWIIDYSFVLAIRGSNTNIFEYLGNVVFVIIFFYSLLFILNIREIKKSLIASIFSIIVFLIFSIFVKKLYDVIIIKNPVAIDNLNKNIYSYYSLELWRLVTITMYGIAYIIYLRSIQVQKTIQETERKLLLTEIAFLKAQINPHFLFNTLNFVFEDISSISPKSGDMILKLAEMLRYSVQSTKLDFTPILKEVEAIDRYIFLQRKRFGDKMYVEFYRQGDLELTEIPPLIMLSLVENAFKYGVIYDEENPIEIFLEANENEIIFSCKNLIRTNYKEVETNAVGITNIRRRLEISYNDNFELENWTENKNYFVHLKIISEKSRISIKQNLIDTKIDN